MPNLNPNTAGLDKPKWHNLPTVAIRIPETFKDEILRFAREIDSGYHLIFPSQCKALIKKTQQLETELEILKAENEKLQTQIQKQSQQSNSVHSNKLEDWYQETLPKLGVETGYKSNSASQLIKRMKELEPKILAATKPTQSVDISSNVWHD